MCTHMVFIMKQMAFIETQKLYLIFLFEETSFNQRYNHGMVII